jgi:hypothetical protein
MTIRVFDLRPILDCADAAVIPFGAFLAIRPHLLPSQSGSQRLPGRIRSFASDLEDRAGSDAPILLEQAFCRWASGSRWLGEHLNHFVSRLARKTLLVVRLERTGPERIRESSTGNADTVWATEGDVGRAGWRPDGKSDWDADHSPACRVWVSTLPGTVIDAYALSGEAPARTTPVNQGPPSGSNKSAV